MSAFSLVLDPWLPWWLLPKFPWLQVCAVPHAKGRRYAESSLQLSGTPTISS